jgi:hypothetical protein
MKNPAAPHQIHLYATNGEQINSLPDPMVCTISNNPNFSNSFAYAMTGSLVSFYAASWSGSATGRRYFVESNSIIESYGKGANYFPGNSAGQAITGGYYR